VTAQEERRIREVVANDIKPMVDEFIAESLRDPDLAAQSTEFRRGWEQGMREGFVAALQMWGRKKC
jgi:hypothetical protein